MTSKSKSSISASRKKEKKAVSKTQKPGGSKPSAGKGPSLVKPKITTGLLSNEKFRELPEKVSREIRSNILRKPANTDNRNRYSDEELHEFRQIILKKLEEARRDYNLLMGQISHSDEHGTDDTSPTFKMLEDGSDFLSKEELGQLASRQQKFIRNLENALVRIENKTYGICRATGKLIEKERLKAVPHATLSYEAKVHRQGV